MNVEEQRTGELKKIYKRDTREAPKKEKEFKEKEVKEKEVKEQVNMVKGLIGKDIAITLRGGNSLKGRLEAVTQYELVITMSQNPVIVMKHAIDYLTPVGEK